MKSNYGVYIDDLKVTHGLIAGEIAVKIKVSPSNYGSGNYKDLNKVIYNTVNEIDKAIKQVNQE